MAAANQPDPDPAPGELAGNGEASRGGGLALNLLLAAVTVLVTFFALEVAIRIYHGTLFDFSSQISPPPNRAANPIARYDAQLGWVPRPGVHERSASAGGVKETWSVNDAGLRNNGSRMTSQARPIVVVGDSFTFGDEVGDAETWPAQLEALLDVPVHNGGVFAYGVDQAYLRAGQLIEAYDPGIVLLAFISDDINRAEFSFYSGWKPYFEYENGELILRNVPVPEGEVPLPRFATVRKAFSYSFLLSALFRRITPRWWSYGRTVQAHREGEAVALELFDRLRQRAQSRNARFAVVALGTGGRIGGNGRTPRVVEQARSRGIDVVDLVAEAERIPPDTLSVMFMERGHYSPRMNGRIAARIAEYIAEGH